MNQRAASSTPLLFPCPFYSFAPSALLFSKIFKGLKKNFHFGEKKFSTKRKFNLDRPKLQYFPIDTRVLAKKYWKTAEKIYTSPLTLLQKFTVSLIQCVQSAIPDLFTAICRENAL